MILLKTLQIWLSINIKLLELIEIHHEKKKIRIYVTIFLKQSLILP